MLCEKVTVKTPSGDLEGHLFVGADGLPELRLDVQLGTDEPFRPATFPAAWSLRAIGEPGILLGAWWAIQGIQEELRKAEREGADVDA